MYLAGKDVSMAFHEGYVKVFLDFPTGEGPRQPTSYLVRFEGANVVTPVGVNPTGTEYSYFLGSDPSCWTSGARGYSEVHYTDLWDGVDLVYRLVGNELKYDLIVRPGGSPTSISMIYEGVEGLSVEAASGDLLVETGVTTVRDQGPWSYQEVGTSTVTVGSSFRLLGGARLGFDIGPYDASLPLVIDPRLIFSTLLGTDYYDYVCDCFIDDDGFIYVYGATRDNEFPCTDDAYDDTFGGEYDVILSKLDPNGTKLLYSTYIGGYSYENNYYSTSFWSEVGGIWVDDDGAVYLAGNTRSSDFPTTSGAYDTSLSSYDGFVLKLSSKGDELEFSTYLGGSNTDWTTDICVDASGNVIVSGYTYGSFPVTSGAFQTSFGGDYDGFVCMLNSTGEKMLYATYLGGYDDDIAFALDTGPDGLVHVTGFTRSTNFPTVTGCYDTSFNRYTDIFVLKLNATFASLEYSTFVGHSYYDYGLDIAVDGIGRAYVAGTTSYSYFPVVSGCYDTSWNGDYDGVIFRLNATGSSLEASTYYGGNYDDWLMCLDVGSDGRVVFAGYTEYLVPTTSDAYSSTNMGSYDIFVGTLDPNLTKLHYGSMFGSSSRDYAWDIWCGAERNTSIVVGTTYYSDFPTTPGAYDTEFDYREDIFVLKVAEPFAPQWVNLQTFQAIEDVPLVLNLSAHVKDLDTGISALTLNASSPYITKVRDLFVTFVFPNGVTEAAVPVNVSDLYSESKAVLNFTVQPVNDPPICNLTKAIFAVEKVPKVVDLKDYTWDEDTALDDLSPVYDSPYLSNDGLVLTALFPDGVTSHEVWVNITDGESGSEVLIRFVVYPIDDPPRIDPLPVFNATEDVLSIFDLTPYVHDPDTPLYQLRITATGSECTVAGQKLHFMFPSPVADHYVTITISDVTTIITAKLLVHVLENNDPPRVSNVPTIEFTEDTPMELDLTPYVSDEDTDLALLTLECDHDACTSVDGLRLTMLYTVSVADHRVEFTVVDGERRKSGSFMAHVVPVNDPPRLVSINDLVPPVTVTIREDSLTWYTLHVIDEDSGTFRYALDTSWSGATVYQNGSMRLVATSDDIGERTVVLVVDDTDGGITREEVLVVVENVNDPPVIVSLGGRGPPFVVSVDEDVEEWVEIEVFDEDSSVFTYSIEPEWTTIEVLQNGTLHLTPTAAEIGERSLLLRVDDRMGGITSVTVNVVVRGVNDPPEIRRIGEAGPPFSITVDERTTTFLPITVYDEEGGGIFYSVDSDWDGVMVFQNGTLRVVTDPADVGEHVVRLQVEDPEGGIAWTVIELVVADVNDPPGKIYVLSPADGSVVPHGTNVTFSVDVRDPDEGRGQTVTVVWTSNLAGELATIASGTGFAFRTAELEPGTHLITITASDGDLESTATLELTVLRPPSDEDDGVEWLTGGSPFLLPMLLVLAILIIVTVGLLFMGRRPGDGSQVDAEGPDQGPADDREGLRELNRSVGTAISELENGSSTTPTEYGWIEDTGPLDTGRPPIRPPDQGAGGV